MKVWKSVLLLAGLCLVGVPSSVWSQAFDPAEYVRTLYRFDLGRTPRQGEVELWTRNILRGTPPQEVRASFLGSEESFRRYDKNLSRYLSGMSVQIYQRPASLDELRFWSNRLIALGGNRVALCMEMLRDAASRPVEPPPPPPLPLPPPPPPVVIVARPVLPAEPIPLATPNLEIVGQAEASMVMVDVFLAELDRCGNAALVANLNADARRLRATLQTLRRIGAEGASRGELRGQLRAANEDWDAMRDRRQALSVAFPGLRLPVMADVNDSMERLGLVFRRAE